MTEPTTFNQQERLWLGFVAAVGLVGVNRVFVYSLLYRRDSVAAALQDPAATRA